MKNKVLEENKKGNSPGTTTSKSVPPLSQSSVACGTRAEAVCKDQTDNVLYDFEERLAIAEYDGQQISAQAERIAYMDTFVSVMVTLPHGDGEEDWLDQRVKATTEWL